MPTPWIGMLLVLTVLGSLISGLGLLRRRARVHPELLRKMVHVGMGLVSLTLPWLFEESWPVLVLAATSVVLLAALRCLKSGLSQVVGGVERSTLGEFYFPVAVAVLFVLYLDEDPTQPERRLVLYCVPVLLLALADAVAALVGVGYGRWRYPTPDGEKSVEGSLAFFCIAYFCVHVPLILYVNGEPMHMLLTSILLAWLAMMFEAVAWSGLDNLVLPLVSFLLLRLYLQASRAELEERLAITVGSSLLVLLFHRQSTLLGSALLGACLMGYASWALGGWRWLMAPLTLFVTYTLLSPRTPVNSRRVHNVHAVLCVSSAGFGWLILAKILGREEFLLPYTLTFAAHLAMIGVARLRHDYPHQSAAGLLTICVLKSWLFVFGPYLLTESMLSTFAAPGEEFQLMWKGLIGLAGVTLAACGFYRMQPGIGDCPADTGRWFRQAAFAGLASALALLAPMPLAA